MPLPKPRKDEDKDDFISRCIKTLNENEKDRFPEKGQIAAICYRQWNESKEKKK